MNFSNLPKVELHVHLDCSLSFAVVHQLNPAISEAEFNQSFIAPPKCTDLADYLLRAAKGIELMQTQEQLRLVTLDLFRQLREDNVVYAEIRFAPLLHTRGGLKPEEVVDTVQATTIEGKERYGIESGVLLCTLRHFSEKQSMQTIDLVNAFKNSQVVGFDIASDEAGFPIDNHIKAFQYARENHIRCTAHAGEAKGSQSVWETLHAFHPERIGHGVRSIEDSALLSYLKFQNIHLEICPTSNVQTRVFETFTSHPADFLYNAGISVGINTDARTISNVTLTDEYHQLHKIFNWNIQQFKKCNLEAIEHSFAKEYVKQKIRNIIEVAYSC